MQNARVLNQTDKLSIVDELFNTIYNDEKTSADLKSHMLENKDQVLKQMDQFLNMRFPELTNQDLADKQNASDLIRGALTSVFLNKPGNKQQSIAEFLVELFKKAGLIPDDENEEKKNLTDEEKQALMQKIKPELQDFTDQLMNELENLSLIPKPKPGKEKENREEVEAQLEKLVERQIDHGLINLYGMDPRSAGSIVFPVLGQMGNRLGFVDMCPGNNLGTGDFIGRQNALEPEADPLGLNNELIQNQKGEGIIDDFMNSMKNNGLAEKKSNTPTYTPGG